MGNVLDKKQLEKAIKMVYATIEGIYDDLDELNGAMYELLENTDIEVSLQMAGITDEEGDIEGDFGYLKDFYMRQLPTVNDLDGVLDVLKLYLKKLNDVQ